MKLQLTVLTLLMVAAQFLFQLMGRQKKFRLLVIPLLSATPIYVQSKGQVQLSVSFRAKISTLEAGKTIAKFTINSITSNGNLGANLPIYSQVTYTGYNN
jgi:hypothetical protein